MPAEKSPKAKEIDALSLETVSSLFNLAHHTLRFTPDGAQFRAENAPWQWDPEFGSEMAGSQAALKNFLFPFSGKTWNSFSVGMPARKYDEILGGNIKGRPHGPPHLKS